MANHDEGGGRNDLLDVRVLRVPSLHFIFGRLPSVHTRIDRSALMMSGAVCGETPKPLCLRASMRPMRSRMLGAEGDIVLILFFGPEAVKAGNIFSHKG